MPSTVAAVPISAGAAALLLVVVFCVQPM